MFCPTCGERNEGGAKYCDACGTILPDLPSSTSSSAEPGREGPAPPRAREPLVVFPPARPRAWWYPIGVWLLLSLFFVVVDLIPGDGIGWAYWPIGLSGIFLVGFPLLHLLEAWTAKRKPR